MAMPTSFEGANNAFTFRSTGEKLPCYNDKNEVIICYQLNYEELQELSKNGGKVFIRFLGATPIPVMVSSKNPLEPIKTARVAESILSRCHVDRDEDMDFIVLLVESEQIKFEVERMDVEEDMWMVTFCHKNHPDTRFDSSYQFGEDLIVFGLASEHYGRFKDLSDKLGWPEDRMLILQRKID